jgi:hypothetical protein
MKIEAQTREAAMAAFTKELAAAIKSPAYKSGAKF